MRAAPPADDRLTATLTPIGDVASLAARWQGLQGRAGSEASFFLSWPWIGTWLAILPAGCAPHLLAVQDRDRPGEDHGLAILCPRRHARLGLLVQRQWFLHETGDPDLDRLMIEYNGLVGEAGHAATALGAALAALAATPLGCDELVLGGVDPRSGLLSHVADGWTWRTVHTNPCPYVDLASIGAVDASRPWPGRGDRARPAALRGNRSPGFSYCRNRGRGTRISRLADRLTPAGLEQPRSARRLRVTCLHGVPSPADRRRFPGGTHSALSGDGWRPRHRLSLQFRMGRHRLRLPERV